MRIGIDFDNTIANYDNVFKKTSAKYKLINHLWVGNKKQLKKEIIKKTKNEEVWKKIQGKVYGKYMHLSKLNLDFDNFLLRSRLKGIDVFIVSHKTIYGHYDKEKILLRKVAMKWMHNQRFFNKHFYGLDSKNIFFEKSIQDKIKRINKLKLDYFVDDLNLILTHKLFSKKTKKILYGNEKKLRPSSKYIVLNNWLGISNHIYGNDKLVDIKKYAEFISKKKVRQISKIQGQKNSNLYKLSFSSGLKAVLKKYPNKQLDQRERLNHEYYALKLMKKNKFNNVTQLMFKDNILNIIIFKWEKGKKIEKINKKDLDETIKFIKKLKNISSSQKKSFKMDAVEACKSFQDLNLQIKYKLNDLLRLKSKPKKFSNLLRFKLLPTLNKLYKNKNFKKTLKIFSQPLKKKFEILSPSDFGLHNALKSKNQKIIFLDFEYFGKDDPVKLIADFLLHPGMNLSLEQKKLWFKKVFIFFKKDKLFLKRLNFFISFYAFRWSLIVLNDFKIQNISEYCKFKKINKKKFLKNRLNQINKSIYFCNLINKKTFQKWLN